MPTYHFDVGDSTAGPIGFCASVRAKSKEKALELLKEILPESVDASDPFADVDQRGEVEYVRVYLNADALTVADIDSEEDIQDEVLSEEEE